jgi:4'-phosphopantetheinyl transferase
MPQAILHDHGTRDLDLWCFYYQPVLASPSTRAAYEALLTPADTVRYRSYVFDKDRLIFLATRALVRTVLSHYVSQPPHAWCFEAESKGKPRLATMPACGPLHFNLSNTNGLVICGVSRHVERLGVDVEPIARTGSLAGIAESHFAAPEVGAWRMQPPPDRQEAFFRYWTLKESFIKATGKGLSTPLDQFSFTLAPGHPPYTDQIAVAFDAGLGERAEDWRFAQWRMPGGYMVALGADTGGASLRCRLLRACPLLPGHGDPMETPT